MVFEWVLQIQYNIKNTRVLGVVVSLIFQTVLRIFATN